jgi:hypothetical protein
VVSRRLPSENVLGPVTLIGESQDDFASPISTLTQKPAHVWG